MASTGNAKNSFNIELLNANNYHTWKFRMEVLFCEKEVMECLEKDFSEDDYEEEEEMKNAKKADNKCKSYIVQCLDDSQIDLIRDKDTAYSMWKGLEERYEKKGLPGQMILRKKINDNEM